MRIFSMYMLLKVEYNGCCSFRLFVNYTSSSWCYWFCYIIKQYNITSYPVPQYNISGECRICGWSIVSETKTFMNNTSVAKLQFWNWVDSNSCNHYQSPINYLKMYFSWTMIVTCHSLTLYHIQSQGAYDDLSNNRFVSDVFHSKEKDQKPMGNNAHLSEQL